MNEDIEKRLRSSRPESIGRDEPLSQRATNELAALLTTKPAKKQKNLYRLLPVLIPIAALIIAVPLGLIFFTSPKPNDILGPVPDSGTQTELFDMVPPEITATCWTATNEDPLPITGAPTDLPKNEAITYQIDRPTSDTASIYLTGNKINEIIDFTDNDYPAHFDETAPNTAKAFGDFLRKETSNSPSTSATEALLSTQILLSEQALTTTQTSALFAYLESLPGTSIDDSATDPQGNQSIAISTEAFTIFFSPNKETITATAKNQITKNAVTEEKYSSYCVWGNN